MVRRVLGLALLVCLIAPPAEAEPKDATEVKARSLFKGGNQLLEAGDYVGALGMFRDAYAAWPNPKILLNMGTALRSLGRYAEAIETYEKYLADPKAEKGRRAEVTKLLAELEKSVVRLEIRANQAEARVLLDGKELGKGSATVKTDPGNHNVSGELAGFAVASVNFTVTAGEQRTVELELKPDAPPPTTQPEVPAIVPVAPPPPPPPPGRTQRRLGLGVAGAGLVAVGVGVVFGLSASSAWDEALAHCNQLDQCDPEGLARSSDAKSAATLSTALLGAGAAAVAAGAVLYLLAPRPAAERAAEAPPETSTALVPLVGDQLGLAVQGVF